MCAVLHSFLFPFSAILARGRSAPRCIPPRSPRASRTGSSLIRHAKGSGNVWPLHHHLREPPSSPKNPMAGGDFALPLDPHRAKGDGSAKRTKNVFLRQCWTGPKIDALERAVLVGFVWKRRWKKTFGSFD